MKISATTIPDVLIFEPVRHGDHRGFFMETWRQSLFEEQGIGLSFVQDNQSKSARGILRGLHYQVNRPQGKLVRAIEGEIFDVAVDLRRNSATFGGWTGCYLDAHRHGQFWIPSGFAHGFLVLSDVADVAYKTTSLYAPASERSVRFDDPDIGILWPSEVAPVLSARDLAAGSFREAEVFP